MAKIETKRVIASSLDNFIVFQNHNYQQPPYVTIGISSSDVGHNRYITFSDMDDTDASSITIEGRPNGNISTRSFNTTGSVTQVLFSLMEALKKISIVYDVVVSTTNTLMMGIDTSRRWNISSDLAVGGNYSQFNPDSETKWVMNINANFDQNAKQFTMEKYNNSETVSFNITGPFQYVTFKNPITVNVLPYSVNGNTVSVEPLTNSSMLVMPTTMNKFESIDYDDYYCYVSNNAKKKFLTRLSERSYNYGERIALSILTNRSLGSVDLVKKYYTNSGVFITSQNGQDYKEYDNERVDFYDVFDLDGVESANNRQVGYVEVSVATGGVEITEPVRYNVEPVCKAGETLFFINAIGGVDSFTFTGTLKYMSEIGENTTYMQNPEKPFDKSYELEFVKQKQMDETYNATTRMVDASTAKWLTELSKSRWVYQYSDNYVRYRMVVIDKMDIDISDEDKRYQIECEYHVADAKINV